MTLVPVEGMVLIRFQTVPYVIAAICELLHTRIRAQTLPLPTSGDLFICAKHLFVAAKEETPATRGYVAGRGKLKQSGSKVEFGPIRSARHWAEHLLSGVVAETGTCSSLPKICLLKPRKPADMGPVAYSRPLGSEPREGPHQGCSESQHR
jgi:hypothetical protein